MNIDLMLARLVFVLEWTIYLLPRVLGGMAAVLGAWGLTELMIYMIRRWKRG